MAKSLKHYFNCLGKSGNLSVIRDLYGYRDQDGRAYTPKKLSLKNQMDLLGDKHLHINVILVGWESFEEEHWWEACYAIQIMREIYGKVDLGIGKVVWRGISDADAGSYASISSSEEAEGLTNGWSGPSGNHDLFVVRTMTGADGWSATGGGCDQGRCNGGTCDKDADKDGMTGSVVSLNGGWDNAGNTFAHEVGHYLGLDHVSYIGNFVGDDGDSNSWTGILGWQGDHMKKHCWIQAGC